jgi:hypothetical protein
MNSRFGFWFVCTLVLATVTGAYGKSKHRTAERTAGQDGIDVIARLPLGAGEPVTRLTETQHHGGDYLYAEHDGTRVTLIDIRDPRNPKVDRDVELPAGVRVRLVTAAGESVLTQNVAGSKPAGSLPEQTFRIMSFADPAHPVLKQEFQGVTAMASDPARGLVFLANADGLWVLQQNLAKSPEQEEREQSILHSVYDSR